MNAHSAADLNRVGQSIWLDHAGRSLVADGAVRRLIAENAVSGIVLAPARLQVALESDELYATDIVRFAAEGLDATGIYVRIVVDDVRNAADALIHLHQGTQGRDGYVSIPISPHLVHDADAMFCEAERVWTLVNRPNVLMQIPATDAGLPAMRRLLVAGINVNATTIFSVDRYNGAMDAHITALETRLDNRHSIAEVMSVASFGVAKINAMLDPLFEHALCGCRHCKWGIALAQAVHAEHERRMKTLRVTMLGDRGAHLQRLLWDLGDLYTDREAACTCVEALKLPNTIASLPLDALDACGAGVSGEHEPEAHTSVTSEVLRQLRGFGIDYSRLAAELESASLRHETACYDANLKRIAQMSRRAA